MTMDRVVFRKRTPLGRDAWLNWSKSGVSASARIGKRLTVNSRGHGSIKLFDGFSWRF